MRDHGTHAPHLLGGEFGQEEMRKAGLASEMFRFVHGTPNQTHGQLRLKLPRQTASDILFQLADEIGE